MHIHLCVITGQSLANLIPILQEKPDHIVLMHSDDGMADVANAFSSTLEIAGYTSDQIHRRAGLPTQSYEAIFVYTVELLDILRPAFPNARWTWNATGGTKLMALAIYSALADQDRIIYADTQHGQLEELRPNPGAQALSSVLTPDLYLHALGKLKRHAQSDQPGWIENTEASQAATRYLAENAAELMGLIQQFNLQLKRGLHPQALRLSKASTQWSRALELLQSANLLEQDGHDKSLFHLTSAMSANYLTGSWLEEYVWLSSRNQRLDYVEAGFKFGDRQLRREGQDNEIDVLVLHKNRLLVVECKSGHMGRENQKDSNIIYKIDSVADQAGGLLATKLLVSAQPLQHNTNQGRKVNTEARANAARINTLAFDQLRNLGTLIRQWSEQGSWPKP